LPVHSVVISTEAEKLLRESEPSVKRTRESCLRQGPSALSRVPERESETRTALAGLGATWRSWGKEFLNGFVVREKRRELDRVFTDVSRAAAK